LAARFVRDEEAAGSNPATPTQLKGRFLSWNLSTALEFWDPGIHAPPDRTGSSRLVQQYL
jgi:hypothetical protein